MSSCPMSSKGSYWLSSQAKDSNISIYVLSLPPSLFHALFTLLWGLPSFQLNMDVWFTGRRSMTDHLLLLLSPSLQLSPSLTPYHMKHTIHQLQTVLHNDFLQWRNMKPALGSALGLTFLTLPPTDFAYSVCFHWSLRCYLLWSCLFPQRRPLCISHAPSVPRRVTWRASDYKKQR